VLPGCPQKLLELIDRCTHYDTTMRPSMADVERELRMVLQSIQSQDCFGLPALWQERGCLLDSPEHLLECPAGSRDCDLIKTLLEQEMGNSTTVLKVEMNANVDLLRRYVLERKKVWHLVRVACGKIFERSPLHLSLEYQFFVQQLASQQLAPGHLKKLQEEKTREFLRMPKNRSCPDGCHSQLGVDISGSRKSKTEVTMPSRPLTSTRPLTFTARHRMCFCNTRVVCTWLVNEKTKTLVCTLGLTYEGTH
jgi:hypothetical protein